METTERGEATVARPDGDRIDIESALRFRSELLELVKSRRRVVLDLAAVEFIDSSGLGALVSALKAARTGGGELRLAALRPNVRQLLEIMRLDRVFSLYGTVEEATT